MKIIATVRTRNEERNIEKFIRGYSFVDKIIVLDSDSTDQTFDKGVRAAEKHKVTVQFSTNPFYAEGLKGSSFSDEPKGINLLIQKARIEEPDWIIYDDCDCYPNKALKESARQWFEYAEKEGYSQIHLYRLYVYKGRWYFPEMNDPGQSLWAWKPGIDVSCNNEGDPRENGMRIPESKTLKLGYPYCVIHNFAQSEKHIRQKMEFYEKVKGQPQLHPKQGCGRLAVLPESYK